MSDLGVQKHNLNKIGIFTTTKQKKKELISCKKVNDAKTVIN